MKKMNKLLIVAAFLILTGVLAPVAPGNNTNPGGSATINSDLPAIDW